MPACTPSGAWARSAGKMPRRCEILRPLARRRGRRGARQAAKVARRRPARARRRRRLVPLLEDPEPRVRFFAAMALGKLGNQGSRRPRSWTCCATNDDARSVSASRRRHGPGRHRRSTPRSSRRRPMRRRRCAWRRCWRCVGWRCPRSARFLNDADAKIVLEAARAIYDVPIPAAMPKLAGRRPATRSKTCRNAAVLRVLAANYRLGEKENAQALVNIRRARRRAGAVALNGAEDAASMGKTVGPRLGRRLVASPQGACRAPMSRASCVPRSPA